MKKFCILPLIAALAFCISCQKQHSGEERKAEVERQVQERLAAERQADEKQRLAQQQADLEAREKALAEKEAAAAAAANVPAEIVAAEKPLEAPATVEETETDDTSETRSTAAYGTFYRKLEPYGAWRETNDYGYVWQPREAEESRDWRPYIDGRWVYTDSGWTWVSEEPFGWATYHYGRWVRLRRVGWVWVPGQQWAPAWVSWRTSKDYVGWAPLPPEARFSRKTGIHNWADSYYDIGPDQYAFVPENEFGSRRIRQSVVPVERNITIVIDTTNVTNITYANRTVVNHGPNFEEMRSRSRQPIERYRLERQVSSETIAPPTVRGEVLVMSAPAITRVQGVDRPQSVKETIAQTTVEKSWAAETDRAAADRARTKMKAEVAPPTDAPSKTFVKPGPPSTSTTIATPATAPASTVAATPALAPPARATPKPASTAVPTVRATPVAVVTPVPPASPSPKPAATAREIAPAISTPSVLASPSAPPRPPAVFPKLSPASTVAPAEAIATPALTPARVPQRTPRRIIPTPMNTPAAPPSSTQPPEAAAKPLPPNDLAPRPVVRPPVAKPTPIVTSPANAPTTDVPPPLPNDTKPVVRQTPPGIRMKPPTVAPPANVPLAPEERKPVVRQTPPDVRMKPPAVALPPLSNAVPPPASEERKANNTRPKRPGQVEGEKPATPAATPVPKQE